MSGLPAIDDAGYVALFGRGSKSVIGKSGHRSKRYDQADSGSRRSRFARSAISSPATGRVHNAYRVPQAVVKIVRGGTTKGKSGLADQLQYISREGTHDIEQSAGEIAEPGATGRHEPLVDDWQRDFDQMDRRTKFHTYHVVVSYPKGTDPVAAEQASRDFADRLTNGAYGDRWKYAQAHHRDTDYPHSHIILNRRGAGSKTLHLSRYGVSIDDLRKLHVETAREYGIILNATSRFSRGENTRTPSSGRTHAAKEGRALAPPNPPQRSGFPGYGAGHREELPAQKIAAMREAEAHQIERLAQSFTMIERSGVKTELNTLAIAQKLHDSANELRASSKIEERSADRSKGHAGPRARSKEDSRNR